MAVRQISIELKNTPNSLGALLKALDGGVNIRILTISETYYKGSVRIIVDKIDEAITILNGAGFDPVISNMLAVEIDDCPGSLCNAMNTCAGINLHYAYSHVNQVSKKAILFLRFTDEDGAKAMRLFTGNGYKLLSEKEVCGI